MQNGFDENIKINKCENFNKFKKISLTKKFFEIRWLDKKSKFFLSLTKPVKHESNSYYDKNINFLCFFIKKVTSTIFRNKKHDV